MSLSDLAHLVETPEWMHAAACRGVDSAVFFPKRTNNTERAHQICRSCSVTEQCLDWALSFPSHYDFGIYAGTNAFQRRKLRRKRNAA